MSTQKRRATSAAVAREAGVSRTTVSLVLNNAPNAGIPEETRRKVLDVAARLNYYPNVSARRLVSGKSKTMAFVIHQSPDRAAADLFLPEVLRGLVTAARANQYHILFHPVDPDNPQDDYANLIHQGYVDGIVLSGPQRQENEAVALFEQGAPIVLTGRLPGYDLPCVDADNYQGAALATEHLIELGHRRIGLITNAPFVYLASQERHEGYHDALETAELLYDPSLVREGYFTAESGYQAMTELLEMAEPPTAVFVASDVVALGAMQAVKDNGRRIPQDVAIVGFDDVSIARYIEPHLTSVHLPAYDLGRQAGELLLRLIKQEPPEELIQLLPTELIIRNSCGAAVRA
jgi:DNA-binding LacI/PurR family transcriptional regulator